MKITILCLLAGIGLCFGTEEILKKHLEHFGEKRYPQGEYDDNRVEARSYIQNKFKNFGMTVKNHNFKTKVNQGNLQDIKPTEVNGVNVVGLLNAKEDNKEDDTFYLIGANYDSDVFDDPLFDNGAGISALLEIAEVISSLIEDEAYELNHSIMFVAFDLNTRDHALGSPGEPGSEYFVNDYLFGTMNKKYSDFKGAIILDSIANFNMKENSQRFPQGFEISFPEQAESIEDDGMRGNFIALASYHAESSKLSDKLALQYNKDKKARLFRVEQCKFSSTVNPGSLVLFQNSDQFSFWTAENQETGEPLPAVLFTDSETDRDEPECLKCPVGQWIRTPERMEFINKISETIIGFLLKEEATKLKSAGASLGPLAALTVFCVILLQYFQH